MRRLGAAAAVFVLAGTGVLGAAGAAGAATGPAGAATVCSTHWGSGDKSATDGNGAPLKNIKTSRSTCYDRMVFDISGANGKAGYHVGYVDAFHQDGSGERIPVRGGAILEIYVSAPSYDPSTGKQSYAGTAGKPLPGVNLTGYKTFKDTRFGASFEGQTQVGLGVRAKLPFRVQQTGDQLIVDVAHTW
ncbi:AMIN-like domain-containing (lipo)protein [Streptomyces sp. NPDC002446]